MTEYQKKQISWLEYRSQVTGKTEAELSAEMAERGRQGGHPKGKKLSAEHKRKISRAKERHAQGQQTTQG